MPHLEINSLLRLKAHHKLISWAVLGWRDQFELLHDSRVASVSSIQVLTNLSTKHVIRSRWVPELNANLSLK